MRDDIKEILVGMVDKRASDLHISAGCPLHYRIDNDLYALSSQKLTGKETQEIIYSLISPSGIEKFEKEKELDFSFSIENIGRFRGNIFMQKGNIGCAIRLVPEKIKSIEECGLPADVVKGFCRSYKGLVLVTGATGSGKSTTLAAMVEEINKNRKCHIVTVEDPIEYVFKNNKAIVDQRQVNEDTHSFHNALRYVLRQDPDVIMIGELRDLESIQEALIIADTGHLVLATLHTSDCTQAINRIVDVFEAYKQKQIRFQLSFVLLGIISQQLIPRKDEKGLVLAAEVLTATPAIRSMIRDGKEHQIYSIMQTSQKMGMRTMNQAITEAYGAGKISKEEAFLYSPDIEELGKAIK